MHQGLLDFWSEDNRALGQKTFAIVERHIEDALRASLAKRFELSQEDVTDQQISDEADVLRRALSGQLDDSFEAECRSVAEGFMARGLDFMDYMIWAQEQNDALFSILVTRTNYYLGLTAEQAAVFRQGCNCRVMMTVEQFFHVSEAEKTAERQEMEQRLSRNFGQVIKAARAGDFSCRVPERVGDKLLDGIAHDLDGMLSVVEDAIVAAMAAVDALALGDLRHKMLGNYPGVFSELSSQLNASITALCAMVTDVEHSAEDLRHLSRDVASQAENLTQSAGEQVEMIGETITSVDHLRTAISGSAKRAVAAETRVQDATVRVEDVRTEMNALVSQFAQISESSDAVSGLVRVIEDISAQTKMLALNASVEAARAGDAGKGFSVVASEVRSLADAVADSAESIRDLTAPNRAQVAQGADRARDANTVLGELKSIVTALQDAFNDIRSSVETQSETFGTIENALNALDTGAHSNSKLAAAGSETAAALLEKAQSLRALLKGFHLPEDDEGFASDSADLDTLNSTAA